MRVRRLPATIASCACLAIAVSGAHARTIRVAESGGDYDSVSVALFAATDGDTVLIEPGTYFEDWDRPEVVLNENKLGLTVLGNRLDPASVTLSGFRLWFRECEGLSIEGIRFYRNPGPVGIRGWSARVIDCIFEESESRYICAALHINGRSASGVVAERCTFIRNRGGLGGCDGGAVWTEGAGAMIDGCLFYDNWSPGIGAAVYAEAHETAIRGCTFLSNVAANGAAVAYLYGQFAMESCTCWNNRLTGPVGSAAVYIAADSFTMRGCIVARTRNGRAVRCDDYGIIECCDFWENEFGLAYGCDIPPSMGNIQEDPLFCSEIAGDVGLASESPCLRETQNGFPCGQIGAFGAGCGRTPVKGVSWGMLKHLFESDRIR